MKKLYSIDLADNAHMRMLAQDLGMKASADPDDAHQVIYSLSLPDLPVAVERISVTREVAATRQGPAV